MGSYKHMAFKSTQIFGSWFWPQVEVEFLGWSLFRALFSKAANPEPVQETHQEASDGYQEVPEETWCEDYPGELQRREAKRAIWLKPNWIMITNMACVSKHILVGAFFGLKQHFFNIEPDKFQKRLLVKFALT